MPVNSHIQMSRMLDVLEEFLTLHGHTYVRLDGSTGVEKRQRLMDRYIRHIRGATSVLPLCVLLLQTQVTIIMQVQFESIPDLLPEERHDSFVLVWCFVQSFRWRLPADTPNYCRNRFVINGLRSRSKQTFLF